MSSHKQVAVMEFCILLVWMQYDRTSVVWPLCVASANQRASAFRVTWLTASSKTLLMFYRHIGTVDWKTSFEISNSEEVSRSLDDPEKSYTEGNAWWGSWSQCLSCTHGDQTGDMFAGLIKGIVLGKDDNCVYPISRARTRCVWSTGQPQYIWYQMIQNCLLNIKRNGTSRSLHLEIISAIQF